MMPLDNAGKSSALAGSNNVDILGGAEYVDHHFVARVRCVVTAYSGLSQYPYWRSTCLLEVTGHRLVDVLGLHKFDKAELGGIVAIALHCFSLNHYAGPRLN